MLFQDLLPDMELHQKIIPTILDLKNANKLQKKN